MPVAPSFQDFILVEGTDFTKNGKTYVVVENPRTHNKRTVRFYSDSEYAKAYGKKDEPADTGFDLCKHARGFDYGPILVIRNDRPADEPWLRNSPARYAVGIGWYIASEDTLPKDAPEHFKYLLLGWKEARDGDDRHIKSPAQLEAILKKKAQNREYVTF